uniref:Beta-1,4-galactosyltransferase 7 n=1 Tax=Parastrongyloides trichosuri TaxID=131310 RepID=A0A0N4Z252_PARTI
MAILWISKLFCYDKTLREYPSILEYKNSQKLCVIVPYRNRYEELQEFVPHISNFLDNQNISYQILVMNQTDTYRFNRASLINVGFLESDRLRCTYFVMHDVDLLPLNKNLNYSYPGEGVVRHISAGPYHPIKRYDYKKFIGGILMLTMRDFKKVNGMSNKYWGWGLEDDEFYLRLQEAGLTTDIDRPKNLNTNRNNTFKHIHSSNRKRDYKQIGNQREMSKKRDRKSGLNNVSYKIVGRNLKLFGSNSQATIVDVELNCDREWTPYCVMI